MAEPLLPETARRIGEIVARAQSRGRVPALAAAVVRDGALVHFTGAGDPTGPDTQFRIGSITKTMTAALVLALRDEERLSLDDPLDRHLPGTPLGTATLRQLLSHVSGLQREPDGQWWERNTGPGLEDFLATLTPGKATHPPYRRYHYSNLAYGLLGAALTRITGQPWAKLVNDRLLEPLGMLRTSYEPREPFARGYVVHPWHGTLHEEPRLDAGAMAPAGQLWSTVADLGIWAAFLTGPDPSVLGPGSVAEMRMPAAISDPESWRAGQGLGLQLWRRSERVYVGHTGSMPGYLAVLAAHPPSRAGVLAFANAYTLHGTGIGELGWAASCSAPCWTPKRSGRHRGVRARPHRPGSKRSPDAGGGWDGSTRRAGTPPAVTW